MGLRRDRSARRCAGASGRRELRWGEWAGLSKMVLRSEQQVKKKLR